LVVVSPGGTRHMDLGVEVVTTASRSWLTGIALAAATDAHASAVSAAPGERSPPASSRRLEAGRAPASSDSPSS